MSNIIVCQECAHFAVNYDELTNSWKETLFYHYCVIFRKRRMLIRPFLSN